MNYRRLRGTYAKPARGEWPAPDFVPRPRRTPLLAWALLGAGVLALVVAALDGWEVTRAQAQARQSLARWETELRPQRAPAGRVVAAAPSDAAASAAQTLVRQLAHPWLTLFQATESETSSGVRWLRLQHGAERGDVRLEGVATDLAALLRCLNALSGAEGWHEVSLQRVEAGSAATPGAPLRFEVKARHGAPQAMAGRRP
jgi:hypothetical protein